MTIEEVFTMDKNSFDQQIEQIYAELDRLCAVIEDPARILGEFFDPYKPNLLQAILTLYGYSERDLYDLIAFQLSKLPALANCVVEYNPEYPKAPLRISYRDPHFELLHLNLKSRQYESTFEQVANGMKYRIRDAKGALMAAEESVNEVRILEKRIRMICGGEIPLRRTSLAKRASLKRYLVGLKWYTKEDASRACDHTDSFLRSIQEEIDKRQAIMAMEQQKLSECTAIQDKFTNNTYLQNAMQDMTTILENQGYTNTRTLSLEKIEGEEKR